MTITLQIFTALSNTAAATGCATQQAALLNLNMTNGQSQRFVRTLFTYLNKTLGILSGCVVDIEAFSTISQNQIASSQQSVVDGRRQFGHGWHNSCAIRVRTAGLVADGCVSFQKRHIYSRPQVCRFLHLYECDQSEYNVHREWYKSTHVDTKCTSGRSGVSEYRNVFNRITRTSTT